MLSPPTLGAEEGYIFGIDGAHSHSHPLSHGPRAGSQPLSNANRDFENESLAEASERRKDLNMEPMAGALKVTLSISRERTPRNVYAE